MALLLLIVIGTSAGWLASIIARTERSGEILRQIVIGVVVSLVAGVAANQGSILGGLTAFALLSACLACFSAMLVYHMMIRERLNA